jgi:hypothetical protein
MAISAKNISGNPCAQGLLSFHFHLDLRTMPLAGPVNNSALRSGWMADSRTTTMSVPFKTKLAALEPFANEQGGGGGDNTQRYKLLPIHAGKITLFSLGATDHFAFGKTPELWRRS